MGVGFSGIVASLGLASTFVSRKGWDDPFDLQTPGNKTISSGQPVLSLTTVDCTETAIARYNAIVTAGGWPMVMFGQSELRLGMIHPTVAALRRRLFVSGDLAREGRMLLSFDSYVEAAVRHFQLRHGLLADGVVGKITCRAMNVSAQIRLNQLDINLKRLHKIVAKTTKETRFVMVNIPAAQVEAVQNDVVRQRYIAIVGKIDRQTPILDSKIHEIILNPFWTIPRSIIRNDVIPLMQRNQDYLAENNIRLFDSKGREVSPRSINWYTDEAVNFLFRQDPGKINAMSSTKINFYNTYAVYMHDTPLPVLFKNFMRFDSSGCVRVQNIRDLNLWILQNTPGWDRVKMEAVIRSRRNTQIAVKDPIPLHFVYISAWSTGDEAVQFRDDIYHLDGLLSE